jgi:hypothetical protein
VEIGGEWESSGGGLCLVAEGCCAGVVGAGEDRFCGKAQGTCTTGTHKKATRKVVAGWYISAGGRHLGLLWEPSLPTTLNGGPMRSGGAAFMVEPTSPFRLSHGQWTLVIEAWQAWDETRRVRAGAPGTDESTPSSLGMHDAARPAALAPISTVFDLTQPTAPVRMAVDDNHSGGLAPFRAWTVHSDSAEPTDHWARDPFQMPEPTHGHGDSRGAPDAEQPRADESTDVPAAVWAERFENLARTPSRTQAQLERVKNGVDRLASAMDEQMSLRVQQLRVLEVENRGLHG